MAMAARVAVGLLVAATVRAEESATVCNIRDHGAVGDGSHLDTAALNACIKLGAGVTILVPAVAGSCGHHNLSSCYLTGAINLTSHQTLRIEKGAGLIGSVHLDKSQSPPDCSHCSWDLQHYPRLPSLPSYDDARYAALVSSYNATGVRIEGEGLLDGQGWALWPDHVQSNLTAQRPHLVELYSCTKCVVEDVVLRNSAFWTLHLIYSDQITVRGVKILAPFDSSNTDGVDIDSTTNVLVENIYCYNGDDCIVVKSGKGPNGLRTARPSAHILARNVSANGVAGIALGSEMSGGVHDVVFEDFVLTGEMGIDIKSGKGRGGYIRDVIFRRFHHTFGRTHCRPDLPCPEPGIENYGSASEGWIQLEAADEHCDDDCPNNCFKSCKTNPLAVPHVDNITFEDITAVGVASGSGDGNGNGVPAGQLKCVAESPCTNINFRRVRFDGLKTEFECNAHVHGTAIDVKTKHVTIGAGSAEPILNVCGKRDAATASASASDSAKKSPPSIIFILSDDLGFGDYSISEPVHPQGGQGRIASPNVDRIAKNGLRFLQSYSGPICAPSRTTLMLGQHMGHTTIRGNDGAYTPLLDSDTTVAKVLQPTHVTAMIGKWGLGNVNTTGAPTAQGYDYFFGQDTQVGCHNWYPSDGSPRGGRLYRGSEQVEVDANKNASFATCGQELQNCKWGNDMYAEDAVSFINQHADKPFFIYLATTTPHEGFLVDDHVATNPVPWPYEGEFIEKDWPMQERNFSAAVWAQDKIVGDVLDALEANKITNDTVVFFSGDNGPAPGQHQIMYFNSQGPFRGFKTTVMEGGIRQTVTVQWPGHIAAGRTTEHIFTFWDFLPTAAELVGAPLPPRIDGISAVSVMLGEVDGAAPPQPRTLYYEFCWNSVMNTPEKIAKTGNLKGALPIVYGDGWTQAVRLDDWKAYRTNQVNEAVMLYDLSTDIGELHNVAAAHPDVIAQVIAVMEKEHTPDPMWPSANATHPVCCANCFSVGAVGCPAPCGGKPPPPPRPPPAPPLPPPPPATGVTAAAINGTWVQEGGAASRATADWGGPTYDWQPGAKFAFISDAEGFLLKNVDCANCCWKEANVLFDAEAASLTVHQIGPEGSCTDLKKGAGQLVWTGPDEAANRKLCVDWHIDSHSTGQLGNWPRWCHA